VEGHDPTSPSDFIPKDIKDAAAKIQKYYLLESSAGDLAAEFFDIEHYTAYAAVGLKSALHDSIIWATVYVLLGAAAWYVQENYLPLQTTRIFLWTVQVSPLLWLVKTSSFGYLAATTGLCVFISRYYTGLVTKRAIRTLFMGRGTFLIVFSLMTFFIFGFSYRYGVTEDNIVAVSRFLYTVDPDFAANIYSLLKYFRRSLFESAVISVLASTASIAVPLLTAIFFRFKKKKKDVIGPRKVARHV
jgi:hypothetical protein